MEVIFQLELRSILAPFPKTLLDENVNQDVVCAHMHYVKLTHRACTLHEIMNVATSMVGLQNGLIRKYFIENVESQRYLGTQKKEKEKMISSIISPKPNASTGGG